MRYPIAIDLKMLPLVSRNKAMELVKKSRSYYKLENQVLEVDVRTGAKILESLSKVKS